MSGYYASGKRSLGICDRCGCRARYTDMRFQIINSVRSGLRVCENCNDADHPQLKLNKLRIDDPQALQYARPESDRATQRELIGAPFDPNFNVR